MQFELFGQEFGAFYIVSQIFALAATILSLYAFQRKKKIQILNYTVVAAVCSVFHYIFAAYETHRRKTSKLAPLVFVLFYVVAGIFAYQSPISLLPVVAASVYTIAIYFGDARKIRLIAVFTASLWLIYSACVFSIVGVVSEAAFIACDLVAIYRYRGKKGKK